MSRWIYVARCAPAPATTLLWDLLGVLWEPRLLPAGRGGPQLLTQPDPPSPAASRLTSV